MARVVGTKPRPRGLIHGFSDRDAVVHAISSLLPTSRRISEPEEVRQEEYDLVVTDSGLRGFKSHLYGLCFGATYLGLHPTRDPNGFRELRTYQFQGSSIATEFEVPDALPPEVTELVDRQLLPLIQSRPRNLVLSHVFQARESPMPDAKYLEITPFLVTTEPRILAASLFLPSGAEVWALPEGLSDEVAWVRAALSVWHRRDESTFPTDPGWRDADEWLTSEERAALDRYRAIAADREAAMMEFNERLAAAQAELDDTRDRATAGPKGLLSGSGKALVDSVIEALSVVGFQVSNMDEINPKTDLLEDLRIESPDDPDWVALAEVRAYAKGAAQKGPPAPQRTLCEEICDGAQAGAQQALVHRESLLGDRSFVAATAIGHKPR